MKILPCLRLLVASRAVALADQQSAAVIVEPKRKPHLYNSHSTIVLAVQPFTSSHLNCLLRHLWNLQWIKSSDAVAFQLLLLMAGGDENLISPGVKMVKMDQNTEWTWILPVVGGVWRKANSLRQSWKWTFSTNKLQLANVLIFFVALFLSSSFGFGSGMC